MFSVLDWIWICVKCSELVYFYEVHYSLHVSTASAACISVGYEGEISLYGLWTASVAGIKEGKKWAHDIPSQSVIWTVEPRDIEGT